MGFKGCNLLDGTGEKVEFRSCSAERGYGRAKHCFAL
jgi:hypothetical protein